MTRNPLYRASCLVTILVGMAFVSIPALAEPDDLEKLAASPQDFLEQQVEIVGSCVKGGVKGDVLGYECTTDAGVYVNAKTIEPAAAQAKIDEKCDGKQDDACRATIRFVPHSFSTSNVLVPDKTITIFNTKKAELSF